MKVLIQRVTQASVHVNHELLGSINQGLLVLLGVERRDDETVIKKMADRLLAYRIFADDNAKMNLSVKDIRGEILVVSQFTLAADTNKGLRPSFSSAAEPVLAEKLYNRFVECIVASQDITVATGRFGADMKVSLINDGPVTFLLEM